MKRALSCLTYSVCVTGLTLLAGCSSTLIGEHLGAEQVVLAQPADVANCQPLGQTTVQVLAGVGPLSRGNEAVEDNLAQMARNDAVDRNANTIVKGNSLEFGKRSFSMYRCKR
jgi:hypothetical protein